MLTKTKEQKIHEWIAKEPNGVCKKKKKEYMILQAAIAAGAGVDLMS